MVMRATSDGADELDVVDRPLIAPNMSPSTVPLTGTSALIGTLSGWRGKRRQRVDEADAIVADLAHADDAAAAERSSPRCALPPAYRAAPGKSAW